MNRLNNEASLMLAKLLALKLALDLDAGDRSSIDIVGTLLSDLSIEAQTFAIRTQICIERCVKYELDNNEIWSKIFKSLNDVLPDNRIIK